RCRRGCRQSGDSRRAGGACRRTWASVRGAAAVAVHRQCGNDRLGGRAALRGGAGRRARRAGAGALAARSGGGKGTRSRGEGVNRIGIIGAGAWGTALAQVAAAGGEAMIWAREAEVVDSIN